jgi:uncharacterized membrane protein
MPKTKTDDVCPVCGRRLPVAELVPGVAVRPSLVELIRKDHPDWDPSQPICNDDLNRYRALYVERLIASDLGELTELEANVVRSLTHQELLSKDVNEEFEGKLTLGQRTADKIASFGGSWRFIIIFFSLLLGWIGLNAFLLLSRPFDPYPFILLNLVLSCLAAIQAPIIMMSQNRQAAKDRLHSQRDYEVNLKSEIEIRSLGERLDHIIHHQWQRLLEIQEVQTDLMEELVKLKGETTGRGGEDGPAR